MPPSPGYRTALLFSFCAFLSLTTTRGSSSANSTTERYFLIPAGVAEVTLQQFANQAFVQFIFSTEKVRNVRTNAIQGTFAPRQALEQMLTGTSLRVVSNDRTEALTIDVIPKPSISAPAEIRKNDSSAQKEVAPKVMAVRNGHRPIDETVRLEEFIVTGVFTATSAHKATVALSTIDQESLRIQVAVSASDLLLNIPGVFVNSSTGEIRNMMYSRGVSADSSETSFGYYYVSLQEDGLPITNMTQGNYGPDYFLRPDATLHRIESVRGGSASITAANAPGGIFNFISKIGTPVRTGEYRLRLGLEGQGSPYYRGDLNVGGPLNHSGWLYNIGGFYRRSDGHRPTGYPLNDGYQLRGNLFKDYGQGSVKIYFKNLNDKNHWYEYLLALDPTDPKQVPGLSRFSTNLFPDSTHTYPRGAAENTDTFDSTEMVHNRQNAIGSNWNHDFGNGWSFSNSIKWSRSKSDWNSSASVAPRSLAWPNFFGFLGYAFNSQNNPTNAQSLMTGKVPAGTYRIFDRQNGALVAAITSNGSYSITTEPSNPGQIVTFSKLPYRELALAEGSFDGVWTNTALVLNRHNDELLNNFSLSWTTDSGLTLTGGGFYSYIDILDLHSSGGRTVAGLVERPVPYSITWTPATNESAPAGTTPEALAAVSGWNGRTVQMTNHQGFTSLGRPFNRYEAIGVQVAGFAAAKWSISDNWNIDLGVRRENYRVRGVNAIGSENPRGNWDPSYGGTDGDPTTMYDNRFMVDNPSNTWNYDKDVDSIGWSIAANHVINKQNSLYTRYAHGEKAPDYGFFKTYNSQFRINNLQPVPQTVQQWEVGIRHSKGRFGFVATPFWSRLGDIFSNPQGLESDGVTPYYPRPVYNVITTYGVEFEGDLTLSETWSIRSVLTWQKSEATRWTDFQAKGAGREDDVYTDFSGRKTDNNPDLMVNTTLAYRRDRFFANVQWKHMGNRPGNVPNVIILPRFNQIDFAAGYQLTKDVLITLNINNAFDSEGVMTWRGWGTDTVNRQSFTQLPPTGKNTVLQYVPVPPRAFFLTIGYQY